MRPLASVFCCLYLWQTCRSLPVLSGCSLDNDVALILRDSRLNGSAAVAVAAPEFGVSFERCADLCCANEGCNALEFQSASGKRLAICLQYSCDDMMDCQGKVDREDDVTAAVWLEKKVTAAYSSSSRTVTSKSISSTLTPLSTQSSTMVKTAVTSAGPSNAADRVEPSPAESKVAGTLPKANRISENAVVTEDDPDSTPEDDDLFRMLVGDRLAEETAHKPHNLLSNISVGMLAAGMIVFGLLLLVIATQLCREKNRIRYTSLA
uniref:MANSC domain-containing protein n=1 Tax=Plectus sambesii TaxID=2011161 RepID=A0A914VS37_9BILA